MALATAIVNVLIAGFTSLTSGLTTLILDVFEQLVWTGTELTPIAVWSLVFAGLAIVFGIVNRFVRA
jgi:hypothetical protein